MVCGRSSRAPETSYRRKSERPLTLGGEDATVTFGPDNAQIKGRLIGASRHPTDEDVNNRSPIRADRAPATRQLLPGANG